MLHCKAGQHASGPHFFHSVDFKVVRKWAAVSDYASRNSLHRSPEPVSRPTFPDIQVDLQRPDFKLLTWTPEDVAAYTEQARTLGAPLEAGGKLYTDIQKTYT